MVQFNKYFSTIFHSKLPLNIYFDNMKGHDFGWSRGFAGLQSDEICNSLSRKKN